MLVYDAVEVAESDRHRRKRGVERRAEQGNWVGGKQQDTEHERDAAADQRVEQPLGTRAIVRQGDDQDGRNRSLVVNIRPWAMTPRPRTTARHSVISVATPTANTLT